MSLFPPALGLLSSGLLSWAIPVFAQDPAGPSPCANGIAVPDPQDHPGLAADCEVLLNVRDPLAGDAALNWSADVPITEWESILVSGSRVTKLYLENDALTGSIPPGLGRLTQLTELHLARNDLTGPIPPELGRLTQLTLLDLHDNRLTGPIPPELGQLAGLVLLNLSSNALTGSIPPELGHLAQLTELRLSDNRLTGSIPPVLGRMPRLGVLHLDGNQLSGRFPIELGRRYFHSLELDGNTFTGCVPAPLARWIDDLAVCLDGPDLCDNGIAVPDPQDHPGLVADCEVLLTTGVELRREMNWSAYTPISRWRGLEFGESRVTGLSFPRWNLTGWLPPEWGQLTELEALNLAGNQSLTGPIPPEWGQLRKLRNLDLGGVNLIRSIPPELGRLTELESLNLRGITAYGGNLVGPIPPELGGLRKLKQLDLHDNHLSGPIPPELGQLTELVWLKLSRNELTGPIPPGLGQLTQLGQLHLHDNELTGPIPPELGQLSRLDWLRLHDNELTGPIPPELGRLTRLRGLQLEGNRLTGPIPPELGELTELVWLKLSGNRLTGPIPPELGQLTQLGQLHLHTNQLTGPIPPELGQLTRLQELNLSHNRLTGAVPPELARLAGLSSWYLAGNQLTCVPDAVGRLVDDLDVPVCGRLPAAASAEGRIYWTDMGAGLVQRADLDGSNVETLWDGEGPSPGRIALDAAAGKMYWMNWTGTAGEVRRNELDGSKGEILLSWLQRPGGLALDLARGKMYYTTYRHSEADGVKVTHGYIHRANLDGSGAEWLLRASVDGHNRGPFRDVALDLIYGRRNLYWTSGDGIWRVDLDHSKQELLVKGGSPQGIALDLAAGKMYWASRDRDMILRADLDGSNIQTLAGVFGAPEPIDIALDAAGGKVYWTDSSHTSRVIYRAALDGSKAEPLLKGEENLRGIALDSGRGRMYWTQSGAEKIRRVDLDGANAEVLLASDPRTPVGLALDAEARRMYWTDWSTNTIHRAGLDGANVEELAEASGTPVGLALDLARYKMYWTNRDTTVIQRADLDGSNVESFLTVPDGQRGPEGSERGGAGIVLDPAKGEIYWTEWRSGEYANSYGISHSVRRASVDGARVEILHRQTMGAVPGQPRLYTDGIALDLVGGKLYRTLRHFGYWEEHQHAFLQRSNLDGSQVEDLGVHMGISDAVAVDFAGGELYWSYGDLTVRDDGSRRHRGRIHRSNLYGKDQSILIDGLTRVGSIALDLPQPGTLVESPDVLHGLPAASGLEPGFPNPFNAGTRIPYRLAAPGPVRMQIFNLLGQPVRTLVDEFHEAGEYQVHWDARDQRGAVVGAGVYFTRLHHPGGVETRRLLVLR